VSRIRSVPTLLLVALALSVLGAVGCGDDNDDVTTPTITVEEEPTTEETVPAETTTTPEQTEAETQTQPQGGGTGGSGSYDPGKEDSATNDKPPEPGSPEEAFEQACKENPAACG
jgi:hypothetical protein